MGPARCAGSSTGAAKAAEEKREAREVGEEVRVQESERTGWGEGRFPRTGLPNISTPHSSSLSRLGQLRRLWGHPHSLGKPLELLSSRSRSRRKALYPWHSFTSCTNLEGPGSPNNGAHPNPNPNMRSFYLQRRRTTTTMKRRTMKRKRKGRRKRKRNPPCLPRSPLQRHRQTRRRGGPRSRVGRVGVRQEPGESTDRRN